VRADKEMTSEVIGQLVTGQRCAATGRAANERLEITSGSLTGWICAHGVEAAPDWEASNWPAHEPPRLSALTEASASPHATESRPTSVSVVSQSSDGASPGDLGRASNATWQSDSTASSPSWTKPPASAPGRGDGYLSIPASPEPWKQIDEVLEEVPEERPTM